MIKISAIVFTFVLLTQDSFESSIDPFNGLSYINTAEDLLSDGIQTTQERRDIEHLFVLAAVVDPQLRNHAILGLASIERDSDFMHELLAMRTMNQPLLIPQVLQAASITSESQSQVVKNICKSLTKIRRGQTIKKNEADSLKPWGYFFPSSLDSLSSSQRKRAITDELITATLQVELAVLGGPTVWSADLAVTGGRPVALSINDDLASRFRVNPLHRIKRNGVWMMK